MRPIFLQTTITEVGTTSNDSISSATQGTLGAWLQDFMHDGEVMVFGGKTVAGVEVGGSWNDMLTFAGALASVFCLILAARVAFRTMAGGQRLDVMAIMRPLFISIVLSNWFVITYTIFNLFRPLEYGFQAMYEWHNERVDSLRNVRTELQYMLSDEVHNTYYNAILADEIQKLKEEKKQREEEARKDQAKAEGTIWEEDAGTVDNITASNFGDVMHDELNTIESPETGKEVIPPSMIDITTEATIFDAVEKVILWMAECYWSVVLYLIFIVKYLYLYVLVMFGPIWIVCSLLDVWKDKWTEWLGRYMVTNLYGTCAFLILTFGLVLLQVATNADIASYKNTLVNEEGTLSYIKYLIDNGFGSVCIYVIAALVTAVALPMAFELATMVFPGESARQAGMFIKGMTEYMQRKLNDTARVAVSMAVGAGLGSVAAASAVNEHLEKKQREEEDKQQQSDDLHTTADTVAHDEGNSGAAFQSSSGAGAPQGGTTDGESDDDGNLTESQRTDKRWMEQEAEDETSGVDAEGMVGDQDADMPLPDDTDEEKLFRMSSRADDWADRTAYFMAADGTDVTATDEDVLADVRDDESQRMADEAGIGKSYRDLRQERLKENLFLIEMVRTTGNIHGRPKVTSMGAVLGMDTKSSPRDIRAFLKRTGLYYSFMRVELLRRMADGTYGLISHKVKDRRGHTVYGSDGRPLRHAGRINDRTYQSIMDSLRRTDAEFARRCRNILAERGIHVDETGKAVAMPSADLRWRQDIGPADYFAAVGRGLKFTGSDYEWFMRRYGTREAAEQLYHTLDVLALKVHSGEADDFILSLQLQAADRREMDMWKAVRNDYTVFRRVRMQAARVIRYHDGREENNN